MSITIRDVDVHRDRDELIPFLRANLPGHSDDRQFVWLYERNPAGVGRAWVAVDGTDGAIVGAAAAFPRAMHVGGRATTCWNLGDFAIRPDHRSLGPAIKLQRACLNDVIEGRVAFAYDHPSCNMMAVYRWLKIAETAPVVRYAKPLKIDRKVRDALGDRAVGRGVGGLGNVLLSLSEKRRLGRAEDRSVPLAGRFDARFDGLDARLAGSAAVAGARDAAYLNWRYADNPVHAFETWTTERGGALSGYAVCRVDPAAGSFSLADLRTDPGDPGATDALVAGVISAALARGAQGVDAPALEGSLLARGLEDWGFRPRDRARFVVSTRPGGELDGLVNDSRNWFYSDGDRDV